MGFKLAGTCGLVVGTVYALSPLDPNRGSLLSLGQDAVLFSAAAAFGLIGAGIGFAVGKFIERSQPPPAGSQQSQVKSNQS
jgi:hypothetical protein